MGAEKPIPQDRVHMEKRSREQLEWNRQTLGVAYDKIGKKDARWDAAAREALDLAARMFSNQVDPQVSMYDIHVAAKNAVDAGCRDPLILYLYARTSVGKFFPKIDEYNQRVQTAADALASSRYSPYRRAVAMRLATQKKASKQNLTTAERSELKKQLDVTVDLLTQSVAEDPRNEDWENGWYVVLNDVIAVHRQLGSDYKQAFDLVDARLAKIKGIDPLRLTVKGNFFMQWGWEARTQAFAPQVTEEQFRTFESRLQQAKQALIAAWEAKPDEPNVADVMLAVEKSIGGGDREAMETWFERAMKANGNDRGACWGKLDWLDPKWYGGDSFEPMIAFGKACLATGNWRTGITLLAAEAHFRYAFNMDPKERTLYLRDPAVWSDIQPAYDEYLKHEPSDYVERSRYATFCYLSAHYPEAHAQFQILGENLTAWSSFPRLPIEVLKSFRDDAANIISGKLRKDAVIVPDPHKQ